MNSQNTTIDTYILFNLGDTRFAISSFVVKQLDIVESVTRVPGAPSYVEGIVFSRGMVIPVVNLRLRLGMEYREPDIRTRMIIVKSNNRHIGLIVDSARDFIHLPAESILPPPENIAGLSGNYLAGVTQVKDKMVLVLNVNALLEDKEVDKETVENNKTE